MTILLFFILSFFKCFGFWCLTICIDVKMLTCTLTYILFLFLNFWQTFQEAVAWNVTFSKRFVNGNIQRLKCLRMRKIWKRKETSWKIKRNKINDNEKTFPPAYNAVSLDSKSHRYYMTCIYTVLYTILLIFFSEQPNEHNSNAHGKQNWMDSSLHLF